MTPSKAKPPRQEFMPVAEALQVIANLRRASDVVVTNQASARLWPTLSDHALDLNYNPSTMGGAVPLALGVALAQPQREVIVVSGEGSLLMSLGSLVTVVSSGATNLTIILLDNGMYEVTGGQATPATHTAIRFQDVARAVGFSVVSHDVDLTQWQARAASMFTTPGPRFMCLQVGPTDRRILQTPSGPMGPRIARFRDALTA